MKCSIGRRRGRPKGSRKKPAGPSSVSSTRSTSTTIAGPTYTPAAGSTFTPDVGSIFTSIVVSNVIPTRSNFTPTIGSNTLIERERVDQRVQQRGGWCKHTKDGWNGGTSHKKWSYYY